MSVDPGAFAGEYNRIAAIAPKMAQRNPGVTSALANASLATGGLPNGLVESTAALERAVTFRNELQVQTPDLQVEAFGRLNDSDRNLLLQLGYAPPNAQQAAPQQPKHHGFFGSVGHFFARAGGDVLGALGAGTRAVQHTYRAWDNGIIRHGDNKGFIGGWGANIHAAFSPHAWSQAWQQTTDGQTNYDQTFLKQVRDKYDPDVYNLAKQMADGAQFDEIAPVGSPQRTQLQAVAAKPEFKQALDAINETHESFGRNIENTLGFHPKVGGAHVISGVLDGTLDVVTDPTLKVGAAAKGVQTLRWGLAGAKAEDIDRMFQSGGVQRAWTDISQQVNKVRASGETLGKSPEELAAARNEGASAIRRIVAAYPAVQPLIQPMLDAGVHDMASAQEFLRGNIGLHLLLTGQPYREMPLMPHALSPVGEAYIASKQAIRKATDWAVHGPRMVANPDILDPKWADALYARRGGVVSDDPTMRQKLGGLFKGAPSRWAMTAQRAMQRVPLAEAFNPLDPDAINVIRRTASAFLPQWHSDQIASAFAAADLGGKRTIYKGLLGQLMHASGAAQSETGRAYYTAIMDDLNQQARRTAYSATAGVGVRPFASGNREVGFLGSHMTEQWALPGFKGMVQVAGRMGVLDRLGATVNGSWIDKAMKWWRWQVLTRPGFGMRAAGDEMLAAVMRGGGTGLTRAFLAQRAITNGKPTPWNPAVGLARVVAKALPNGAAKKVNNVADLSHQWTIGAVAHVLRKGAEITAGKDFVETARKLSEDPLYRQSFAELLHSSRFNDVHYDGSVLGEASKQKLPVAEVKFASDGGWDVRTANGWEGSIRWAHELEKLMHDPAGARAARMIADGTGDEAQRVELIRQVLAAPSYKHIRDKAEIADVARDGRRVSMGEVHEDVALRDWAQDIHDHAMGLLSSTGEDGDTVLIRPVLDHILEHDDAPGASALMKMEHKPEGVVGKTYVPIAPPSGWDKFSDKAFELLATKPLNFLSRQPLTVYHYHQARGLLRGLESQLLGAGHGKEAVEDIIHRHAIQRAVEHTVAYVHNPKMRTQLSLITRNFLPFRHAEEGFYTRWARTMRDSPASVRKAQLLVGGLAHSGMIQKDQQTGQEVFVYPGTGFVYDAIRLAHNHIPGLSASPLPGLPKGLRTEFTSPVVYLNPGLTQLGTGHVYPQGGPLATLSMGVIRRMFPEAELPRKLERVAAGEQGAGKPLWSQFVPTVMQRLYQTWGEQSDTEGQLASATRGAIQALDAIGQTPPAGASVSEVDHYLNRVKAMTRTLMTMRVALGFVAPAAPSAPTFDKAPDPEYVAEGIRGMRDEFVALTHKMTYDAAVAEFQRMHPDESPFKGGSFIAPQSKTPGDVYAAATSKALDFMTQHTTFLKDYKLTGALLIPNDPGDFNYDAYREQMALGMRKRQSISEFYDTIKTQTAERQYYAVRDQRDALVKDALVHNNKAQAQNITHMFDVWSQEFQAVNPLFAQFLAQGGLRAEQRSEAMDEIVKMVQDPNAPIDASLKQPLTELAAAWAGQQADLRTLSGYTTSRADDMRKAVRAQFSNSVAAIVAQDPRLIDLYNRVIRPMESA